MIPAARQARGASLAQLTLDQIAVVGMPPDIAGDKRAEGDHRQVLSARVVQRRLHQLARDTLAIQLAGHFGVDEEDRISSALIFGHRQVLIEVGFSALGAFVVFDFQVVHFSVCHCSLSSGGWRSSPSCRIVKTQLSLWTRYPMS
jgi:hypothetical protein